MRVFGFFALLAALSLMPAGAAFAQSDKTLDCDQDYEIFGPGTVFVVVQSACPGTVLIDLIKKNGKMEERGKVVGAEPMAFFVKIPNGGMLAIKGDGDVVNQYTVTTDLP